MEYHLYSYIHFTEKLLLCQSPSKGYMLRFVNVKVIGKCGFVCKILLS